MRTKLRVINPRRSSCCATDSWASEFTAIFLICRGMLSFFFFLTTLLPPLNRAVVCKCCQQRSQHKTYCEKEQYSATMNKVIVTRPPPGKQLLYLKSPIQYHGLTPEGHERNIHQLFMNHQCVSHCARRVTNELGATPVGLATNWRR